VNGQRLEADKTLDPDVAMLPVEVNWYAAAAYCNWLSEQEGLPLCYPQAKASDFRTGMKLHHDYLNRKGYRLPTEAEWEYACRSETRTSYCYGEGTELLRDYATYSGSETLSVGSLKPNDFGLFDMHGNLWEWCQDPSKAYPVIEADGKPIDDVEDVSSVGNDAEGRVLRGGSFNNGARFLRSAYRYAFPPDTRFNGLGFRVARTYN
jgi:formylglycine-generating enzyme required for sulfatase activity